MDKGEKKSLKTGRKHAWATRVTVQEKRETRIISVKAMATHSSVLAWRIPGTGEPGGLPSMGSHRVGHD